MWLGAVRPDFKALYARWLVKNVLALVLASFLPLRPVPRTTKKQPQGRVSALYLTRMPLSPWCLPNLTWRVCGMASHTSFIRPVRENISVFLITINNSAPPFEHIEELGGAYSGCLEESPGRQ